MKAFRKMLPLLLVAPIIAGCSVPFDITTDAQTMTVPNTVGAYIETTVNVPEEALNPKVSFDTVTLYYTIRLTNEGDTHVKLYASPDQTIKIVKDGSDVLLIDESLTAGTLIKSGTVVDSAVIRDILNSKNPKFVIGLENVALSLATEIDVDIKLRLKGAYTLF